jgi:hypothetical protein
MTLTKLSYIVALAQEQHFGVLHQSAAKPLHAAYHVASLQPMLNPWISTP